MFDQMQYIVSELTVNLIHDSLNAQCQETPI